MLRATAKALCSVVLVALATSALAGKEAPWITNMDQARKIAKAEGKDIFMFFTGSDWCGRCIKLDNEVLSQQAFLDYAKDHLVLVDLDFPNNKELLTKEQQTHNQEWIERFPVQGFPTIYITDSSAIRYAVTGYQDGGPDKYVDNLKTLKANKAAMENTLAKASRASGLKRAKLLDEVLSLEGAFVENSDALMNEVIKLSKADRALNDKYVRIKGNQDLMKDMRSHGRLNSPEERLEKMLGLFHKYSYLKEGRPLDMLLQSLGHSYSMSGKAEEGLAFMDKLYKDSRYPAATRQTPGIIKAFMTAEQGDMDKATSLLDKALALAPESEAAQHREDMLSHMESMAAAKKQ